MSVHPGHATQGPETALRIGGRSGDQESRLDQKGRHRRRRWHKLARVVHVHAHIEQTDQEGSKLGHRETRCKYCPLLFFFLSSFFNF